MARWASPEKGRGTGARQASRPEVQNEVQKSSHVQVSLQKGERNASWIPNSDAPPSPLLQVSLKKRHQFCQEKVQVLKIMRAVAQWGGSLDFALHVADLGLVPDIPSGSSCTSKSDS